MLSIFLAAVSAHDHLTPIQQEILNQPPPPPKEYRFSFELPAGPQFTEAEKEMQRSRGREVWLTRIHGVQAAAIFGGRIGCA